MDVQSEESPSSVPEVVNAGYSDAHPIDALQSHPENPRRGDLDSIVASIIANGFYGAVMVQKSTGRILAGNHRWQAAKQVGMTSIPVQWVECDDLTAKRILLADNRTNDLAGYDDEVLVHLLEELQAEDALIGSGYDSGDLDALLDELGRDEIEKTGMLNGDDLPDHIDKVVAEIARDGDLWECGGHRIFVGDSTKPESFAALFGEARADLVFTSPPYNVGVSYDEHDDRTDTWERYEQLLSGVALAMRGFIADGRAMCWNIPPSKQSYFARQFLMLETCGYDYRRTMIWHKNSVPAPQWWASEENPVARNYRANPVFEFVFVFETGTLVHGDPVELDDTIASDVFYVSASTSTRDLPSGDGATGSQKESSLESRKRPKAHPATFPVDLPKPFVSNLASRDEIVLDPFCGAGSTLLAAHRTRRRGYGVELTPRYVDLALWRLQTETGELPQLLNGKGKRKGSFNFRIDGNVTAETEVEFVDATG